MLHYRLVVTDDIKQNTAAVADYHNFACLRCFAEFCERVKAGAIQ